MLYKIKLKNADEHVLLSSASYEFIENNEYYKQLNLLENLRLHASGYVFFQKNFPKPNGGYKNVTIYLHKLVAEKFVPKHESERRLFVRIINGNPLDCREKNLGWATMAELRRNQKHHHNKTGYRGVVKVSKKTYRAVLYSKGERYDLGLFPSAESAAEAYNQKSKELFGKTKSLNNFKEEENPNIVPSE
ncbi:AP2/ERF family transcription factor [Flammeovirga aprica]|uniref:Pathogenesis-related transcriptional factor and ERF protein n=1 Tax=Flammeovirga aprica JL-4 TaxID=694437 RepID=A0A7X9RTT2_9BACT|nr:Pathogenesis-related transcriptional factor and ERF protein [Flammeovirga aprica]NME67697.1 Pathogenesis-related transcriptional factor and ERF protein [Flammeovirga aprica JL-4]